MEIFSALLSLFAGNPPVTGGSPAQRDSNVDLWCFFVFSLNKLLNKHWIGWKCETQWRPFDVDIMDTGTEIWRLPSLGNQYSCYIRSSISESLSLIRKNYGCLSLPRNDINAKVNVFPEIFNLYNVKVNLDQGHGSIMRHASSHILERRSW